MKALHGPVQEKDIGNRVDQLSSLQPSFSAPLPSPNNPIAFRSQPHDSAALGSCLACGWAVCLPLCPFSLLQPCSPGGRQPAVITSSLCPPSGRLCPSSASPATSLDDPKPSKDTVSAPTPSPGIWGHPEGPLKLSQDPKGTGGESGCHRRARIACTHQTWHLQQGSASQLASGWSSVPAVPAAA